MLFLLIDIKAPKAATEHENTLNMHVINYSLVSDWYKLA